MTENKDVAIILNKYDELLNKNLISEAGEYLEKEIEIAKSENDSFAEMTLHNEVVSFHRRTGEQAKAVSAINEILELIEKFILLSNLRLFARTRQQKVARKYHSYFFVFRKRNI